MNAMIYIMNAIEMAIAIIFGGQVTLHGVMSKWQVSTRQTLGSLT